MSRNLGRAADSRLKTFSLLIFFGNVAIQKKTKMILRSGFHHFEGKSYLMNISLKMITYIV